MLACFFSSINAWKVWHKKSIEDSGLRTDPTAVHGLNSHALCAIGRWMCGPRRRSDEGCVRRMTRDTTNAPWSSKLVDSTSQAMRSCQGACSFEGIKASARHDCAQNADMWRGFDTIKASRNAVLGCPAHVGIIINSVRDNARSQLREGIA